MSEEWLNLDDDGKEKGGPDTGTYNLPVSQTLLKVAAEIVQVVHCGGPLVVEDVAKELEQMRRDLINEAADTVGGALDDWRKTVHTFMGMQDVIDLENTACNHYCRDEDSDEFTYASGLEDGREEGREEAEKEFVDKAVDELSDKVRERWAEEVKAAYREGHNAGYGEGAEAGREDMRSVVDKRVRDAHTRGYALGAKEVMDAALANGEIVRVGKLPERNRRRVMGD